jgi:glyoxylase-like metal-dependent hydrolase (beta-lactamase superfamily II)
VKIEIGFLAFLLISGEEKILVDTGPPAPAKMAPFHKPYSQSAEETLEAQLARFQTRPEEIRVVINTHLHWDHCYRNSLFTRASFYVQKRELDYARNPLPLHLEPYEMGQEGIVPPFEGIDYQCVEGDVELEPGITLMLTPGHSLGIQTVGVRTRQGLYIIAGDTIPLYDNLAVPEGQLPIPNALHVDLREYVASLEKIKWLGGLILPGHELKVLEKAEYP